jgi:hypothetical protein
LWSKLSELRELHKRGEINATELIERWGDAWSESEVDVKERRELREDVMKVADLLKQRKSGEISELEFCSKLPGAGKLGSDLVAEMTKDLPKLQGAKGTDEHRALCDQEDNEDDGDLFMQLIAASIAELKVGNNLESEGPNGADDLLAEALVLAEDAENDSLLNSCLVAAMLLVDDDDATFEELLDALRAQVSKDNGDFVFSVAASIDDLLEKAENEEEFWSGLEAETKALRLSDDLDLEMDDADELDQKPSSLEEKEALDRACKEDGFEASI